MAWTNLCSAEFYRRYILENEGLDEETEDFKQTKLAEFAET